MRARQSCAAALWKSSVVLRCDCEQRAPSLLLLVLASCFEEGRSIRLENGLPRVSAPCVQ